MIIQLLKLQGGKPVNSSAVVGNSVLHHPEHVALLSLAVNICLI
jgi:hypothetical protein